MARLRTGLVHRNVDINQGAKDIEDRRLCDGERCVEVGSSLLAGAGEIDHRGAISLVDADRNLDPAAIVQLPLERPVLEHVEHTPDRHCWTGARRRACSRNPPASTSWKSSIRTPSCSIDLLSGGIEPRVIDAADNGVMCSAGDVEQDVPIGSVENQKTVVCPRFARHARSGRDHLAPGRVRRQHTKIAVAMSTGRWNQLRDTIQKLQRRQQQDGFTPMTRLW